MKTTKMIAAVLAVFLVAALFIGAGAAVTSTGTAYVYQYSGLQPSSTYYLWQAGQPTGEKLVTDTFGTIALEGLKEGLYSTNLSNMSENVTTVKYPTLALAIYKAGTGTSIADTTVTNKQAVDFSLTGLNGLNYSITFTSPAGGKTTVFGQAVIGTDLIWNDTASKTLNGVTLNVTSGTWSALAEFSTDATDPVKLISTTPSKYLPSNRVTFTIGAAPSDSISINKDTIVRGSAILLTVTGTASTNVLVTINEPGFNLFAGQSGIFASNATTGYLDNITVTLSKSGSRTIELLTNSSTPDKTYTFSTNQTPNQKAKIVVTKGAVTATAAQAFYYVGNDITISGTNTETDNVYFFIKGSNVDSTLLTGVVATVGADNTWTKTFNPKTEYKNAVSKNLDAGTYTFYAASNYNRTTNAFDSNYAYASLSVALKQPFLTATAASSTVAKGDDIQITGTAEATDDLKFYVFGTNKYMTGAISVDGDGVYSKDIDTSNFDAGQYYVIIQHPMYDGNFNVMDASLTGIGPITLNTTAQASLTDEVVVDVATRQSANAAEALKVALDRESIDDIYVPLTFIVAQPNLYMNTLSDVTKGSALKVSGTTNLKVGTVVTVDVLSTAFTAMEKTSVNSASFITLTTKVVKGTDGVNTWEVTFDTTGLNVDSYTIQAATDTPMTTSTIIKVLEAKPTATATGTATATKTATATATATPTTTPGFGAFLALAGLGAVAVLVLRRD